MNMRRMPSNVCGRCVRWAMLCRASACERHARRTRTRARAGAIARTSIIAWNSMKSMTPSLFLSIRSNMSAAFTTSWLVSLTFADILAPRVARR